MLLVDTRPIPVLRRTLGGLLRVAEGAARARVYAQMPAAGFPELRPAHSSLLRNLSEAGLRVSELAERAQVTKQSMGYLADSLAAADYVTLEPDPTDRRAKRVLLTVKGRAAADAMVRISAEVERDFAGLIGKPEMTQLRTLLEQLAEALSD
jgi:DNA-binding MarR family transcriptional regulator